MYDCRNKVNYFNYVQPNKDNGNINNDYNNFNDFQQPMVGLSYGNISKKLYKGYKNYKPVILSAEVPMHVLQAYNFMLLDLGLYLDTNPYDEDAIKLYNAYILEYRNLVERFERINYPLDLDYQNEPSNNWKWINNWQIKGGNN